MRDPGAPRTSFSTYLRLIPVLLGLLGIIAGIVLGALHGNFLPWHFALGGLSILSIIGGLAWVNDLRWKETLASITYSVFFVVSAALVYLISANRDQRLDLTQDKVHTLSPLTKAILTRIPDGEHVTLQAFSPNAEHIALQTFLDAYRRVTPRFQFELYDAQRDLNVVQELGGDVSNGELVATRWDRQGMLVRRETTSLDVGSQTRENDVTNAVARLFSNDQQVVYFTSGHGEKRLDDKPDSLTKVAKLLASRATPVKQFRLIGGAIPEDAGAIVIAGPTIDLLDFERELLEQYANSGGKLLIMVDPALRGGNQLANLEQFLATLHIEAKNEFLVDPVALNATGLPLTPLAAFADHPITNATSKAPFVMQTARPLLPIDPVPAELTQEPLLVTSNQVWAEGGDALRSTRRAVPPDDPKDIHARYVGVAVEKKTAGGRYGEQMRAVVLGDSDAFRDDLVEKNGDAATFFIQATEWLRVQDDMLKIPPKLLTSTPITLTSSRAWTIVGVLMLLGMAITVGGTSWTLMRRRAG